MAPRPDQRCLQLPITRLNAELATRSLNVTDRKSPIQTDNRQTENELAPSSRLATTSASDAHPTIDDTHTCSSPCEIDCATVPPTVRQQRVTCKLDSTLAFQPMYALLDGDTESDSFDDTSSDESHSDVELEKQTKPAECKSTIPDHEVDRLRRTQAARNYLIAQGDMQELMSMDPVAIDATMAYSRYAHMLEALAPTASLPHHQVTPPDETEVPNGLWPLMPLPDDSRAQPDESRTHFHLNPLCKDFRPIVGPRTGGKDRNNHRDRHTGTRVTVDMLGIEAEAALYGQYISKEKLAGSLRCDLHIALASKDHTEPTATVSAIADTGASWTAVRADQIDLLIAACGKKQIKLERSYIRFTGISGDQLSCLGWMVLSVKLGSAWVNTRAFIFADMHEPMLLGMNTLAAHRMCVDTGVMSLYRSPYLTPPPGSTPLFVRGTDGSKMTNNPTMAFLTTPADWTPDRLRQQWRNARCHGTITTFYSHSHGPCRAFSNYYDHLPFMFTIPDNCGKNLLSDTGRRCSLPISFAEKAIMLCKASLMGDLTTFDAIVVARTPAEVQTLGRTVAPFDEELWHRSVCGIAYEVTLAKFSQLPKLHNLLASTGRAVLAEASPTDLTWGIGWSHGAPSAQIPSQWRGANVLGWALMEVRHYLKTALPSHDGQLMPMSAASKPEMLVTPDRASILVTVDGNVVDTIQCTEARRRRNKRPQHTSLRGGVKFLDRPRRMQGPHQMQKTDTIQTSDWIAPNPK